MPVVKPNFIRKKLVIVGDGSCGKTCLLMVYTRGEFPGNSAPTVFENYMKDVQLRNGTVVRLGLWDTAGQEGYSYLRPLSYDETDVILLCFGIESMDAYTNATVWANEVKHFCPAKPILLVGCKMDLRHNPDTIKELAASGLEPVTVEQGQKLAKEIQAQGYYECSALTRQNVKGVFEAAIQAAITGSKNKKKCTIL